MESSKLNTLQISVNDVRGSESRISELELIGNYSVKTIGDKSEYFNDLSQLRYYKEPADTENVNFHLGAIEIQEEVTKKEIVDTGKESAIATSKKSNTVADTKEWMSTNFLLQWILENLDSVKAKNSNNERYLEPDFISTRGPIKALLDTPFEKFCDWIFCASKFKGSIYLAQYYSDDRKRHMLNWTPAELCNLQRGCVFKKYMLSDTPFRNDDSPPRIDTDGHFYCVFKTILDNKTLLYSAEIDGIRSQQIVEDTVVGKNLELIELKTAPSTACKPGGVKDANRMFTWWTQCYLADVQTIICGCKNENGDIKRIQEIKLDEFSYHIKDKQIRCLSFWNGFLDFIKKTVSKEHDKCLYKFEFNREKRVIFVDELAPNCDYAFLHPWYFEKVEDYFAKKKSASRS